MELGYGKILSIELNFAQICTRFFFKKINFFLTFIPKFNSNICFKGLIFFFIRYNEEADTDEGGRKLNTKRM